MFTATVLDVDSIKIWVRYILIMNLKGGTGFNSFLLPTTVSGKVGTSEYLLK